MRSIVVVERSMQDRPSPSVFNRKAAPAIIRQHRAQTPAALISEVFRLFQTLPQDFPRLTWISWHCGLCCSGRCELAETKKGE
jgi:hypothetical protein